MRQLASVGALWLMIVSQSGCPSAEAVPRDLLPPRPVTVLTLQTARPEQLARHTGTVAAWKTEDLAFQVGGRLFSIVEPGTNIEGETFDENGQPLTEGTVLARLETERYVFQLDSVRARERTAAAQLRAAGSELNDVLPKQTAAAQAAVTLAEQQFERTQRLFEQNAASIAQLDKARADLETSQAELQQLEQTAVVKEAQRASYEAQLNEAEEAVRSAQKDLDDTVLRSPFHGQVAEVYAILGGVVQAGTPVCRVQMMDPIEVQLQVSAETDASLNYNDIVQVYTPGDREPSIGLVYEKAAVAEASTRTFTVTLLVRNQNLLQGMPGDFDPGEDVRVRSIWAFYTEQLPRKPPFFLHVESLHQDEDGSYYIWKVNAEGATRESVRRGLDAKLPAVKVPVTPGERRMPLANVAVLREITGFDESELDPDQDLVLGSLRGIDGKSLESSESSRRLMSRGHAWFVREQWKLRPGDIVHVDLQGAELESGFYVPMDAISHVADEHFVYVLQSEEGENTVHRVPVNADLVEGKPTLRRITAASGGNVTLEAGQRIVSGGVHFLADGERVQVSGEVESSP